MDKSTVLWFLLAHHVCVCVCCDSEIDVPLVGGGEVDKPVYWWDGEADKCLLVGVFKHGWYRRLMTL